MNKTLPIQSMTSSILKYFRTGAIASLLLLSSSCNNIASTNSNLSSQAVSPDTTTLVVSNFADQVVIPTYQQLVEDAEELSKAVNQFVENPTEETLKAAQNAWIVARSPWEQSEAFAFGPAESLGYDGDLDDWPVNETDVVAVINSQDEITLESVKKLQTTQKGFHTIEYLLFGLDSQKTADDFSKRELKLLQNLTLAFNESANNLTKSWAEGVNGNPAYREVLATAGTNNNPAYPTPQAAVEEIIQGMLGCLDEVANEKIGKPLETKDNLTFESRFSQSSLTDFKNNLKSVENAYLGQISATGTQSNSISGLVAQKNPELDQKIKQELKAALEAINAVPAPIESTIKSPDATAKLTSAKSAILTLFSTIETQLLPLLKTTYSNPK
ncbi:imelysin family protein [Planktothrix sp. FACHB-1365]|uniref:imelysin family protein n=1 Tax=Planktothrix sp. FACHB-1365 TaxID=2692855 RepID=UPI00168200CB|nr:imelysin family protein [Planktothrix sp. FACHB-1365]MBD2480825.1 peptidase M75 [Planktothrix sp. FACHB-1365]